MTRTGRSAWRECLSLLALAVLGGIATHAAEPVMPPPLNAEALGQPLQTMRRSGDILVPKPDGAGWYFITSYNPIARNKLPCQFYIVDLDTGAVTMKKIMPSGGLYKAVIGRDGKAYIGHYAAIGLHIFDPRDASWEWLPFPEVKARILPYRMAMAADDGRIYMGTASASACVIEFDPATRRFRNFGVQGPKHRAPRYIYYLAVGDTHVYSAAGKNPWYLVATDRTTMKQAVLMKGMAYLSVSGSGDACYARVKETVDGKPVQTVYKLQGSSAVKSAMPRGKRKPKGAEPEMLLTLARPTSEGRAQIWWRLPGKDWRHADLAGIQTKPWSIRRVIAMPDGRLFGAPSAYEDCFLFDPKTGKFDILGKSPLSSYALECLNDKVVVMGYPGTYMVEYDPTKPWTFFTTTPVRKEPKIGSAESNPRECHRWSTTGLQTHHVRGSAIGADGFIYMGAHAERSDVGGAIGWWDPVKRKPGGLRDPFRVQDCCDITSARDGKAIVYSSRPVKDPSGRLATPPEGKLFVLDTATKKIVSEIVPAAGMTWCGPVAGVGDKVFGIGRVGKQHVYYVVDLNAGKTIHTENVPERPVGHLRKANDGRLYIFVGSTLVRIDPKTHRMERLGTVEKPGVLAVAGADLYWPGGATLYRLRGVAR